MRLSDAQVHQYNETGFLVVSGLFATATAQQMIEHYMDRRAEGPKSGDSGGTTDHPEDPNHQYPRMINMHNWDALTGEWAMQETMLELVEQLINDKPVLRQTMLYFKPPGGRGQALHQDEQYITTEPLIGVWIALDKSDRSVGQMVVVPGSHRRGLLQVEAADTAISFTAVQSVMPEGAKEVFVDMEPGDALFFDGKTIHGSYMNETNDRWRRSFICHYIGENAEDFEPPQGKHVSHLRHDA